MSIKGFQIEGAVHRYDYNALDNKPVSDASLSVVGRFADAAAVGNAIAAIRKSGTNGGGSGEGVTSTRGTGIYKIVSPPVFYKANFGNFTSTYRIALATTKVQAGVTDVFVGDIIEYNIFHYPVGYVDKNYVYLGARTSIQGADGYSPTVSAQKTGTETVLTIVNKDEVTTATIFDGAPGRSVTGVTEYYKVSNDYVNPPPYGEDDPPWSTDPSAESAKLTPLIRYLWNYEVIHYSDGELSAPTTPVMIGVWGDSGKDGIGISDVLNYYWANNKTHLTEAEKRIQTCNEWTIEVQTTTENNPYLWNYEEIIYSDSNKAHKVTKPCIIGHYGADGFSPIVTASKSGNATTISITDKTGTKPPVVILDGTAATTYSLINSHPAIIKAADGSFTPAAITLSAKSQTGNDTPQDYAGIFKIDVYDGSSWSYGRYISSVEEQTTQYTIPAGTQQICCSLYLDRATTILADQEIIGVVSNGTSVTITSKSVKYQKGTSGTNAPTGEWTNEIPSNINEGEYLWTRTVVNYSDGNSTISYSVSRYATNGTSPTVILTNVYYIQNNNGSAHPDENSSSWNPNPPSTTVPGQYVWTKTIVTYSDGATSVSYSVTRNGTDGEDAYTVILDNESHTFAGNESSAIRGSTVVTVYAYKGTDTATPIVNKNNITGMPNGMSVTSVSNSTGKAEITFDVTTSMTSRSGVVTIPVTVGGAGGKVFNKLFSYSLALKGQRGIAIREVTNYYLASSQSSGVTSDDVDWTSDPTDEKAQISEQKPYLWNYEVVKGDLNQIISTTFPIIIGRYAQDGIPGTPGRGIVRIQEKYGVSSNSNTEPSTWYDEVQTTDAVNRYLWNYEIITYTSGTITQTTKKRIIGMYSEDGAPATAYSLIVSHAAIAKSVSGTFSPSSITLTAKSQTGANALANYSGRFKIEVHNGSSWSTKYTSSSNENTKSYTIPSGTTQVRCSLYLAGGTTTLLDQQTIPVVSDGAAGGDAYTIILDNESHTFAGGTSAAIAGTATVNVYAYKGATAIAPTVTKANISGLPTGMSVQSVTNDSTNKKSTIVFAVTTSMVTRSGMVTIPVVVDGKTFNKEFSYSLALQGTKGDTGQKGDKGDKGDTGAKGDTGEQGIQGYSIVAYVTRNNFTEAEWTTYGTIDHVEYWNYTSGIRNGCRVGDLFAVVGTSTDGGKAHTAIYKSTTSSGDLRGTCIAHTYADKGDKGDKGVGVTSITKTGTSGTVDTYTIKYTDNTSTTFTVTNGTNGTNGTSAEWFYGTALTHTSGTATATISGAKVRDMYLNTATSNVYKCTAKNVWTYAGNIADGVIDNISIGGRNLIRRTDFSVYGNNNIFKSTANATFSADKIIVTSAGEVYHKTYSLQALDTVIPSGTAIICSVYVYAQTFTTGNHKLYVSPLKSDSSVHWVNTKLVPTGTIGLFTWTYTLTEDAYGFVFEIDTRNATDSGQFIVGRPKAEIGNIATDWTPAPEDVAADIESAQTAANNAQATANQKKQTFISTPTPPYYEGDAYFKTESGESGSAQWYVCTNTRLTAYGTGESWEDDFEPTSYALESSLQSTKTELLEEDKKIKASVEEQKKYTDGKVTPLETRTSTLEQAARDLTLTFNTEVSDLKERTKNNENDLSSYQKVFAFTENGLQISEQRDKIQTPSVLQIDNGKISFIVDGQEASYWSGENSMFYVGDIVVGLNKKAQFGNFAWIPRSNGNLSFRWVGSLEDNN